VERTHQIAIVERLLALIRGRTTDMAPRPYERDVSAYHDPVRLEQEKEILFRRVPLWAAFSSDLSRPGDFVTHNDTGVPILIVRRADGGLGAFINVCRHRGTILVGERCGHSRDVFRCPYHGWSYKHNGSLFGVPFPEGFAGMDRSTRGLIPVPVAEKFGMIFVCGTPGGEIDLDEHLGPLGPELESWGVGRACRIHEQPLESPIDWKFALDVFSEGYHFSVLHKDTIARLTYTNVMTYDAIGPHYRLAFPSLDLDFLRDIPKQDWEPLDYLSFVYYIYPNISLNVTGAKVPTVRVFRIVPGLRVGHSITHHTLYSRAPVEDEAAREMLLKHFDYMHKVVEVEDHRVAITAQAALAAPTQKSFIFGRNEPSLIQIHSQFDRALAGRPVTLPETTLAIGG
jgi:phenylpropionate dioxygenase-like ring-hydroxylating dioxygenase large terminal subunit